MCCQRDNKRRASERQRSSQSQRMPRQQVRHQKQSGEHHTADCVYMHGIAHCAPHAVQSPVWVAIASSTTSKTCNPRGKLRLLINREPH